MSSVLFLWQASDRPIGSCGCRNSAQQMPGALNCAHCVFRAQAENTDPCCRLQVPHTTTAVTGQCPPKCRWSAKLSARFRRDIARIEPSFLRNPAFVFKILSCGWEFLRQSASEYGGGACEPTCDQGFVPKSLPRFFPGKKSHSTLRWGGVARWAREGSLGVLGGSRGLHMSPRFCP